MTRLTYDPADPFRVEWVRDDTCVWSETVTLPAPGFTAWSVLEYATRDVDVSVIETTPTADLPVATPDAERTAFVVGSLVERARGDTDLSESPVARYERLCRVGRRVLTTPGVPSGLRVDHGDLSLLDVPHGFIELVVHPALYDADGETFLRPPDRRASAWHDRFGDLPVETVRIRQVG